MILPPPGRTAAPEMEAGARPAPRPQPPAPTGTTKNKRTRANAPGCHTDRALRRQASTNRSGMGARPSMTRATPRTPTLLPAKGRQRDRARQGNPPPHWPPKPHSQRARRTGAPPPPAPPPGTGTPQGRRPKPRRAHSPKPDREKAGPGRPPSKHAKRSTGPGQDTRSGTGCVERPYQRPAPKPREVRAPHQPGEGGRGERTPRERERTHTRRTRGEYQKGNRTDPAERTDRMEWRMSERG